MYAFQVDSEKQIKIQIQEIENGILLEYHDTGRGLSEGYKQNPEKILEALETDKRNLLGEKVGTGMGMWIIHNIVNDYNGEIDLSQNKQEEIGFHIKIKMKMSKRED